MSAQYTLALQHPFTTAEGNEISSLFLRRAKLRDLKTVSTQYKNPPEQEIALFAKLTGLLPEDLEEMDLEDWTALQALYQDMMGGNESPAQKS